MEDDQTEDDEAGSWLVEIYDVTFGTMLLGFLSGSEAQAAFNALKPAFVLGETGKLILQQRDENGNWIEIDQSTLK